MRIGLVYATRTGHSKKIALAVAQALQVDAVDIRTKPVLGNIDLLYIVGGIYGGKSSPDLAAFVKTITGQHVKRAVLMTSSGGKTLTQSEIRQILVGSGVQVIEEEFICQGSILFVGVGHPNANDIQNAIAFATRTARQLA